MDTQVPLKNKKKSNEHDHHNKKSNEHDHHNRKTLVWKRRQVVKCSLEPKSLLLIQ